MRIALAPLALIAAAAVTADASASPLKIGVVDVQKVMESVPAWISAVAVLKQDLDKKQAELEQKQASLRQQKEQLDAKKTVADPKQFAQEEAQLMQNAKVFQGAYLETQQELNERESRLKDQMLSRIEVVVYALAERDDYTYVFESGAPQNPNVLYSGNGVDVTKAVILGYKERYKEQPFDLSFDKSKPSEKPKRPGAAESSAEKSP